MTLETFSSWLDATPISEAIKASGYIIPFAQSLHILSVAFVFSGAALLVARDFGRWGTSEPLAAWAAPLIARQRLALAVLVLTGAVLILAEPTRELVSRVLQVKVVLVALAAALAVPLARRQLAGRSAHGLSVALLGLWGVIIFAGRWIAYAS